MTWSLGPLAHGEEKLFFFWALELKRMQVSEQELVDRVEASELVALV
ncbi:MAG: hypothetical protein AAF355_10570 [Myxococcota bacterium]